MYNIFIKLSIRTFHETKTDLGIHFYTHIGK